MTNNDPIKKPVRLLVTHQNPDLDAIGSCWLFMRYGGSMFSDVAYYFVQAGNEIGEDTLKAKGIAYDEVVHVDTGLGVFDHHQPDNTKRDSGALRVYDYLAEKKPSVREDEALRRVVNFINETDHFASFWWPEPADDRYMFMLEEVLSGLRSRRHFSDWELLEFGMVCLDGIYTSMKIKVSAEYDIETKAFEFESPWGTALAIENKNDEVIKLGQKKGMMLLFEKMKSVVMLG
jgi:hypothetical protein